VCFDNKKTICLLPGIAAQPFSSLPVNFLTELSHFNNSFNSF